MSDRCVLWGFLICEHAICVVMCVFCKQLSKRDYIISRQFKWSLRQKRHPHATLKKAFNLYYQPNVIQHLFQQSAAAPYTHTGLIFYFLTCLTILTALTFHSILVRVMGIRRRIERKVSWLMLPYRSSKALCRRLSWVCRYIGSYDYNNIERKQKVPQKDRCGTRTDLLTHVYI